MFNCQSEFESHSETIGMEYILLKASVKLRLASPKISDRLIELDVK